MPIKSIQVVVKLLTKIKPIQPENKVVPPKSANEVNSVLI